MDTQKVVGFLDGTAGLDPYMREVIIWTHSGRRFWQALSLRRTDGEIIEVAKWCRRKRGKRFAALRWSLDSVSLKCRSFITLREARAHALGVAP